MTRPLSAKEIERFVVDGFVRLDDAFPRDLADQARAILWRDTGCDPDDPRSWTRPVIRLGWYTDPPFVQAANTPRLHGAYDQLVGEGAWQEPHGLGSFPVRFPSTEAPGDDGWHVEAAFAGPRSQGDNYLTWHTNLGSHGRSLLMLFLMSDIGPDDAPTRIRIGSHRPVARLLQPAGVIGFDNLSLARKADKATRSLLETAATGPAGTVYLCHPHLVHAAQPHRGRSPRFMAQPPLMPTRPFRLGRDGAPCSPVERAILAALDERPVPA